MNTKLILSIIGSAALALAGNASAAQLVTNGDFSAGSAIFGGSPTSWNATVGAAGVGQFSPAVLPPLSGQVAYMGVGTQIIQTFAVSLAANTQYTISFDFQGSVGDFSSGINTFNGFIGYGSGSGGTSGFAGFIAGGDLLSGANAWAPAITTSAQSFSVLFTTPGTITGSVDNLAIILNPDLNNVTGAQTYLDNVSVTTTAVPEPSTWFLMSAGLCTVIFLRRRRMA